MVATQRNPEATRHRILEVTAEVMHQLGYQGLRMDDVVQKTGLTKGAIYHHFPNKQALGYAVVDNLLKEKFVQLWITPLQNEEDEIMAIQSSLNNVLEYVTPEVLTLGCPICNLGTEMAAVDDGFRNRIDAIFTIFIDAISKALIDGQQKDIVRSDIDARQVANLLIGSAIGIMTMAKCAQSVGVYRENIGVLKQLIEGLRAS